MPSLARQATPCYTILAALYFDLRVAFVTQNEPSHGVLAATASCLNNAVPSKQQDSVLHNTIVSAQASVCPQAADCVPLDVVTPAADANNDLTDAGREVGNISAGDGATSVADSHLGASKEPGMSLPLGMPEAFSKASAICTKY